MRGPCFTLIVLLWVQAAGSFSFGGTFTSPRHNSLRQGLRPSSHATTLGSSERNQAKMAVVVHVAGYATCGYFQRARDAVVGLNALYPDLVQPDIQEFATRDEFRAWLTTFRTNLPGADAHNTSPLVWLHENQYLGGASDLITYLQNLVQPGNRARTAPATAIDAFDTNHGYEYDVVVIGGGSGGLACSQEIARLGGRVAVLDFVKPSPQGSTWGLGGTCVNVGCIPKKLMHTAALMGEGISESKEFGWEFEGRRTHSWEALVSKVQDYIKSLNFGYRVQLRDKNVTYLNKLGRLIDAHTIETTDKKGKRANITAARIVIAVGGRPSPLECPGGEHAISSDDLFSLERHPGKVCVVGAGYVALECAGFLTGIGCDVTVLVRSMPLRGFDRDCADRVAQFMINQGTKIMLGVQPASVVKQADGRLLVTYTDGASDVFDTVLTAIGRTADTAQLGLENVNIRTAHNGKISCNFEQTSVPNIYALGDVVEGTPELTPVAIMAGRLLAGRFAGRTETMDYENVATTIFTPLEFGTVGLSEDQAIARYGEADVDALISEFVPLEWSLREHPPQAYAKVVFQVSTEKVLGMHILSPNAGEIIQGYACAFRRGLHTRDLSATVGIHPTVAEEFTILQVTKKSGQSAGKTGC